jgi:hypothetical protein
MLSMLIWLLGTNPPQPASSSFLILWQGWEAIPASPTRRDNEPDDFFRKTKCGIVQQ